MDLKAWGTKISHVNNLILIRKKGSKFLFEVTMDENKKDLIYNVKMILPNNEVMLTFKDIKSVNDSINTFNRYIGSNEYYFYDGNLELRLNPWKTSKLELVNLYENRLGKKFIINDWILNSSLLFILIPDWKDSTFYKLLTYKYPFLFSTGRSLIEFKKGKVSYTRKSRSKNVQLIETYTKSKHRSYILTFENTPLLESEALFISVFKGMLKYLKTINFGSNKSVLAQTIINGKTYSLHQNVKINNKTKPNDYWNLIKDSIEANFDKDYLIEVYPVIKLVIYNLDDKRNKKITIHKNNSNLSLIQRFDKAVNKLKNLEKRKFSTIITPIVFRREKR
jgi:hypothetical protein